MSATFTSAWKLVFVAAAMALFPGGAWGQGGVKGKVIVCQGHGIPGVTVDVKDAAARLIKSTSTDRNGEYQLERIPAGKYRLEFRTAGYHPPDVRRELIIENNQTEIGNCCLMSSDAGQLQVYAASVAREISLAESKELAFLGWWVSFRELRFPPTQTKLVIEEITRRDPSILKTLPITRGYTSLDVGRAENLYRALNIALVQPSELPDEEARRLVPDMVAYDLAAKCLLQPNLSEKRRRDYMLAISNRWGTDAAARIRRTSGIDWPLAKKGQYAVKRAANNRIQITAAGTNPTAGYRIVIQRIPTSFDPPEFRVYAIPPSGLAAQVITPYQVKGAYVLHEAANELLITDGDGPHRIALP